MQHRFLSVFHTVLSLIFSCLCLFVAPTFAADTTFRAHPELYYEYQLALLDTRATINLEFTPRVKHYLEEYIDRRRGQVSQMLGLGELYFPLFDSIISRHGLPKELRYLAVVESALNPRAVSRSQAVGLWQFKLNSGIIYGLTVDSVVDLRMDPTASTEAACLYLKDLYATFGDWHLALTAYNMGPTALQAVISRAKSKRFRDIAPLLPEAAQNYVPAFVAANYVMQHAATHGIRSTPAPIAHAQTVTIRLDRPLSLTSIAVPPAAPLELLSLLNPQLVKGIAPAGHTLRIPRVASRDIAQRAAVAPVAQLPDVVTMPVAQHWTNHTVRPGDSLIGIAQRYGCSVADILDWNANIESKLRVGSSIKICVYRN